MFKKILITGISGQLGSNIAYLMHKQCIDRSIEILGTYNEREAYSNYIRIDDINNVLSNDNHKFNPDLIIHCAALANIDICETNPDLAFKSNVLLTEEICNFFPDSKIVYISTDNVYYGGDHTYTEEDPTISQNNYGRTKLLGEKIVEQKCDDHLIFRTNIYGWDNRLRSNSFLERIFRNFLTNQDNHLFHDAVYCPISINLLFDVLLECLQSDICGTYNIVGPSISKLEFGRLICQIFGFDCSRIKPISIDDVHLQAQRPKILNLSNKKIFNICPKINISTFDQIDNMKTLYKLGYKDDFSNFIYVGD